MTAALRRALGTLLIAVTLFATTELSAAASNHNQPRSQSQPQSSQSGSLDFSTDYHVIVGVLIAVGVVAGVGIYFAVRKPRVTGCAVAGPDGLKLLRGNGQPYTLTGDTATIKPGDRVKVFGKKKNSPTAHEFIVQRLGQDYGPCPAVAAKP